MMTRASAGIALAMLVVFVATAQCQDRDETNANAYIGETGGALLGGALVGAGAGIALGLLGYRLFYDPISDFNGIGFFLGAAVGVGLGYPSGCGLGTALAGGALNVDGNIGGAYGGAFLGMGLGALGFFAPRAEVGFVAMGVLAPAGAVIGYNVGPTSYDRGSYLGSRVLPPGVAFSMRSTPERQVYAVADCRLVTMRF